MNKRAQAGSVATFLLLMAVFIIFYVLLIPPPERQALLGNGEKTPETTETSAEGELLLSAFPGEVFPLRQGQLVRDLGSITLFSKVGKEVIDLASVLSLKSKFFGSDTKTLFFKIDDPSTIEGANLVFFVNKAGEDIKIELNGFEIYDAGLDQNSLPINLPANLLKESNNLRFIVKSGFFSNQYEITDVKVSLTKKLEKKIASRSFSLTEAEKKGVERATLSYFVNCLSIEDQGTITIFLNDKLLYSDFASCDVDFQNLDIPLNKLKTGFNSLEFRIDSGDYVVDDPAIILEMAERNYPIYNFEVDDSVYRVLFNSCYDQCVFDCERECSSTLCLGECIDDCSNECNTGKAVLVLRFAGDRRKVAAITINEFELNIDTFAPLYEADITGFLRRGSNSIKIIPKAEFEIQTLQIFAG